MRRDLRSCLFYAQRNQEAEVTPTREWTLRTLLQNPQEVVCHPVWLRGLMARKSHDAQTNCQDFYASKRVWKDEGSYNQA